MKTRFLLSLFIICIAMEMTSCSPKKQKDTVSPSPTNTVAPFEKVFKEHQDELDEFSEEQRKSVEPLLDKNDPEVVSLKKNIVKFSAKTISALEMESPDKNSIFAPFNYYITLAALSEMTSPKAKGELLQALEVERVDLENLQQMVAYLEQRLLRGIQAETKISTSLWINQFMNYNKKMVTDITQKLKSDYFPVNFMEKGTTERMSQWISENTHNILGPQATINGDYINQETELVILNALYFYDEWTDAFEPEDVVKNTFTKANKDKIICDFMSKEKDAFVYIANNYKAPRLNLKDNSYLLFVLPNDTNTTVQEVLSDKKEVEKLLDFQNKRDNEKFKLELNIPKFSISRKVSLENLTMRIGISSIFKDNTSFEKITENDMFVEEMSQTSKISIDEKGCTAASYTEIVANSASSEKMKKLKIILDRPFGIILVKRDIPLLYGVVNNPVENSKNN